MNIETRLCIYLIATAYFLMKTIENVSGWNVIFMFNIVFWPLYLVAGAFIVTLIKYIIKISKEK